VPAAQSFADGMQQDIVLANLAALTDGTTEAERIR